MIKAALLFSGVLGVAWMPAIAVAGSETDNLQKAIQIAIDQDPWLTGSASIETALENEAIASAQLPDPLVSLKAGNLPMDTFDLNQEGMTQFSIGISQLFPRGDSLVLAKQQKQQLAAQQPMLRQNREARVEAVVSQLWLEATRAQLSISRIERDRSLFEQLAEVAEVSYASAFGMTRQDDVIRAQLELTRLEDRLTDLRQQQEAEERQLTEWLGSEAMLPIAEDFPELVLVEPSLFTDAERPSRQLWYERVRRHPAVLALEQKIDAMETGVDVARQQYKPEWGVSAQYGYREDDPMGGRRSDLFSVGVAFDLPVFTENRQDKNVAAAASRHEAVRYERETLVRELIAQLETNWVKLARLDERLTLYTQRLLPEQSEQAEASLNAYNNDDGDFAEAVRARIDETNAGVELIGLKAQRLKVISDINYLLSQGASVR
ncbi:TolC family protein [Halomonas titanicae]|uniref:TolC family protein n=1 Tax=Vreelandella titanicae TaxID=664683 RepID=UPI0030B8CD0C|nr:TolC family protein [Halomonas titanicae]